MGKQRSVLTGMILIHVIARPAAGATCDSLK